MPELPEVEVVRAGLHPAVSGAVVEGVAVLEPRSLRRHEGPPNDFVSRLQGATILSAVRRGKFLWFPLELAHEPASESSTALVAHLGMSGQVLLRDREAADDRLLRIRLDLAHPTRGHVRVAFVDQRIFGSMALDETVPVADGAAAGYSGPGLLGHDMADEGVSGGGQQDPAPWLLRIPHQVAHIARDPLDPAFDDAAFSRRLRARKTGVKRALLDQTLVSGIGNIYADESLWASKIHFEQQCTSLSARRVSLLLLEIRAVLYKALAEGGTSFDEQYKNVNGESGYFAHSLNAYGQQGKPCPRCGTPIRRVSFMNRGSHFCPRCQRLR
ncbi:Fpg/Nei family DNA glycosylase [Frondihabitans australicus]|uniref:Formamidopyrimidine-DNA glycosylase n=1 Tax=Frondihabitans australicus TaxID=386892 RepID=A0A495ICK9_9MICO|nr:Fpg/Nei family DNA glycosylase [Frondihabitans australicus]RKR73659.1 formamidopyrimidine-DNA glycosylase [Frondihabitans australicus]